MADLLHWLLFVRHEWKAPAAPPLHPLQLARSQADLHFRASGLRVDQVAPFTAAKTLQAFFFPPSSLHLRVDYTLVIFPVTLISSVVEAAKKLSKWGKWSDANL